MPKDTITTAHAYNSLVRDIAETPPEYDFRLGLSHQAFDHLPTRGIAEFKENHSINVVVV